MRFLRSCALVVLLVAVPTGCVGDDQPAEAVGTQPPRPGGMLRIGTLGAAALDPLAIGSADPVTAVVADAAFDGLTAYDPATRSVIGAVASDWATEDGRVWTFELDADRTFADGTSIRAADVIRSLERAAVDDRQELAGARLEIIDGVAELRDGAAANATGLEAVDGSVRITLTEPNRELPALLADPTYGIVPAGDGDLLVGSGPYGQAERRGSVLVLNPSRPEAGSLDGITVRSYDTAADVATAFSRGELDVMVQRDGEVPALAAGGEPSSVWVSDATLFVGVNVTAPGLDDEGARAALLSAVDPAAVASSVGERRSASATDLVPGDWIPSESCEECFAAPADREKVLGAFGDAGVRLVGLGSGAAGAGATAVESTLRDAGVTVTRPDDTAAGVRAAVLAGEWDLIVFAQVGLAPTPDPFLAAAFATGGRENLTGWSSPVVDGQVAAGRAEPDRAARVARYAAAEVEVRRQAVARPMVELGETVLLSPKVHGAAASGGLAFDVQQVSLGS